MQTLPAFVFRLLTLIAFLYASATSPSFRTAIGAERTLEDKVNEQVQPYLANGAIKGLTIGIYHHQQPKVYGFGTIGNETNIKPNGTTIYEIGSISKVFTGILLGDAVTRGEIRLDQPIQDFLPEGIRAPTLDGISIAFKHLATHTSGLPRLPSNMKSADDANPYADYTTDQLFDFLNHYTLERRPGFKSEYSNYAVGLSGQLLARAAGASYEELLQQRVAQPLGLKDTTISLSQEQSKRLALPHHADNTPAANWDIPVLAGAGAIRSTVNDMLRFIQANLHPPQSELGEAIELAWSIHQPPLEATDFAMGLGWHVARDGSTRWHNGQTGGYHSMMFVNRQFDAGVVVLANTATGEVDRLAEDLIKVLAGATVTPRVFEVTKKVSPEAMQRYVGKFELVPGFVLTVSVVNDQLMVGATGQPTFQVFARSETEWFYQVVKATLTFDVDESGNCDALDLFQNGIHQAARRVEPQEKDR